MYLFLHVPVHSLLREGILIVMHNFFLFPINSLIASEPFIKNLYTICLENFLYYKKFLKFLKYIM